MSDDNVFASTDFSNRNHDAEYGPEPVAPDLGEILARSWLITKHNMGSVAGAFGVIFVLQLAFIGIIMAMAVWGTIDPDMYWPTFAINQAVGLVFGLGLTYLMLGFYRICLNIDRAEYADAGLLLSEGDKFGAAFVVFMVQYLVGLFLGCTVVGPMIFNILLMFAYPLIVDEGLSGVEAISKSFSLVIDNVGLVLMLVLTALVAYLVFVCPTLGLAGPLFACAIPVVTVVTYRAVNR